MIRQLCFLAASTVTVMLAAPAAANVIFSDSFDRTTGSGDANGFAGAPGPNDSDWGSNDNAFGGAQVQTYTFDESRGGGAQQTTNGSVAQFVAGGVQVELDLAPLAPTGYSVAFDFDRAATGGFIGMAFGLDDTDQIENTGGFNANTFLFTNPANGADGAVLFGPGPDGTGGPGVVELWEAGVQQQVATGLLADDEASNSAVVTVSAPSGYGAGAVGALSVSVNGSAPVFQSITFDGVSGGFLSFYSPQQGGGLDAASIDNLVVSAIPEPTTAGLMLAGLAVVAARRRV